MSGMNMSPPHISDMPQPYPQGGPIAPQYQQGGPTAPLDDKGVSNAPVAASVAAQNYRDQCRFHFVLCQQLF